VDIARKESVAQKCKGGSCEKRKQWHSVAGGGIVAQASMDSQKNTQYDFSVVVEPIRFITGSDSVVQSSAERYQHSPTAAVRIYPYLTINGFLYSEFPEYS